MGWLDKLVKHLSPESSGQQSKQAAKERLKLALTYDRGGLAQGTIARRNVIRSDDVAALRRQYESCR